MKRPRVNCLSISTLICVVACATFLQPATTNAVGKDDVFTGGESPFVKMAEDILPSVVNISADKIRLEEKHFEFEYPPFELPFGEMFKDFKDFFKQIPRQFRGGEKSLGSGVVISQDGYILTNNHVISGASNIVITCSDKTTYRGDDVEIVGTDKRTDLAVLKVRAGKKLQPVRFGNSDALKIGDWAVAVGNPLGLDGSVTVGVISAKGRSGISLPEGPDQQDFIQTDASIHPGNSGGPLLNIRGEVVGINTAIASRTGYWQGIGFAIPINLAESVYKQLIENGRVVRGWLGVNIQELTGDLMETLNAKGGVLVSDVLDGSPAEESGLESGDVIVEFDGKEIGSIPELQAVVADTPPGAKVKIVVVRDGMRRDLKVEVGEMPVEVSRADIDETVRDEGWLGVKVGPVKGGKASEFGVTVDRGVLVEDIRPGSLADEAGLRLWDIILEVNKQEVKDVKGFLKIEDELRDEKGPILLRVQRGSRKLFIALVRD